jgi:hypothetical protein
MSLADGDPAKDGDVWFRVITSESHFNKTGIKHAAFKGKFLGPASPGRSWTQEASGRLRSLSGTPQQIATHAASYCTKIGGKYVGIMFFHTARVQSGSFENIGTSINYTPIPQGKFQDHAHADLNFTGKVILPESPEEEAMIFYLLDRCTGLFPEQVHLLHQLHLGRPPTPEPPPVEIEPTLVQHIVSSISRLLGFR